jgi:hypothetical protein
MKQINTSGKYFLYKTEEGYLELWRGQYGSEWGYRAGYVSDADNFEYAVEVAEEELRVLMAEG